ncbi:MAG: DUF4276 family protein [Anaerolineae bacterium]|nr:DUF4276 family protein [Anaerolineae bacterium]
MHLEFLLEEESMENVIEIVMEQIVGASPDHTWTVHPHHSKGHLLKQLLPKLRGYRNFLSHDTHIVIIVDQDQDDCRALKRKIVDWAVEAGLETQSLVRIAVCELESWFLGDIRALEEAFPKLRHLKLHGKARYRNPDERTDPKNDLDREMTNAGYPAYSIAKRLNSLEISYHMSIIPYHNRSHSFQITVQALRNLLA